MATLADGTTIEFSNRQNAYDLAAKYGDLEVFQNAGKKPAFSLGDGKITGYVTERAARLLKNANGDVSVLKECDIALMSINGGEPVPTLLVHGNPANRIAVFRF